MTPFLQLRLRLETTYDYSILDFFPTGKRLQGAPLQLLEMSSM